MTKRQLFALFVVQLVNFTEGNAVGALLPVYAGRLGADTALAGFYLSWNFAGLALGTIAAGWLSDRLQRRKALLVIAGVGEIITVWLWGQARDNGQAFVCSFL